MARAQAGIYLLSGSTNGKGVKVAATATPGTTIHTAVTGENDIDLIRLWAVNEDSSDIALTLEWGGTTDVDNTLTYSGIPHEIGPVPLFHGEYLPLNNGLIVKAYAGTTNKIVIYGYVSRSTNIATT